MNQPRAISDRGLTAEALHKRALETEECQMLDRGEEERLMQLFQAGDQQARHRILTAHQPLVYGYAGRLSHRGSDLFMDLVQEGNLGLIHALGKFEPTRGNRFLTYAGRWVHVYIQACLLRKNQAIHGLTTQTARRIYHNFNKDYSALEKEHGRPPTRRELAARLKVSVEKLEAVMLWMKPIGSLDAPLTGQDGVENGVVMDLLIDAQQKTPEELLTDPVLERKATLTKLLEGLPERERDLIIARHLGEDVATLEIVGGLMGISRERVRQLEARAFGRMKKMVVDGVVEPPDLST